MTGVIFPNPSGLALGPTLPPVQWVPYRVCFPEVKRQGRGVNHPPHLAPRRHGLFEGELYLHLLIDRRMAVQKQLKQSSPSLNICSFLHCKIPGVVAETERQWIWHVFLSLDVHGLLCDGAPNVEDDNHQSRSRSIIIFRVFLLWLSRAGFHCCTMESWMVAPDVSEWCGPQSTQRDSVAFQNIEIINTFSSCTPKLLKMKAVCSLETSVVPCYTSSHPPQCRNGCRRCRTVVCSNRIP